MVIAEQVLSPEQETFIIETTKDFDEDFQKLDLSKQKKVTRKLELITKILEMGDTDILFKYLEKINPHLVEYTSSLYKMRVGNELRIFLFYEDDPLFNRHTMTLLRVCHREKMNQALISNLVREIYQGELVSDG